MRIRLLAVLSTVLLGSAFAVTRSVGNGVPEGSRVYVAPMNGFETYMIAALNNKKVPVVVVASRENADFEISGTAESQKASAMRVFVSGTWRSDEKASITVTNLHTDVVIYAYAVQKWASWHGQQSTAEACAKHLKESLVKLSPEELAAFHAQPLVSKQPPKDAASNTSTSAPGNTSVSSPGASAITNAQEPQSTSASMPAHEVSMTEQQSLGDVARQLKEKKSAQP